VALTAIVLLERLASSIPNKIMPDSANPKSRLQNLASTEWNPDLYDTKHAFVAQFGADVMELLNPQHGEAILDLGCGTGHLAQQMADRGAKIIGIDSSSAMIEQARSNYPDLQFEVADATQLPFSADFDAVFSNAVLHWITTPEAAIANIWQALKPGGRFVAEFGGKGNVQTILDGIITTWAAAGYSVAALNPWYFPSIAEYATLLEQQGFEVTFARLFDRPTPLEGQQGLQNWVKMFGSCFLQAIPAAQHSELLGNLEAHTRATLYRDGTWFADYRRIRIIAVKPV
jgi:trans-aconitate methyltransferase